MPENIGENNPIQESEKSSEQPAKAHLFDPEDYLEKKALWKDKAVSEEVLKASLERLSVPVEKVEYQESGNIHISTEKISFSFGFSPPNSEMKMGISEYVNSRFTDDEIKKGYLDLDNWRQLNSLDFDARADKGNILSYLGPDSKIMFCPTTEDSHGQIRYSNYSDGSSSCDIYIVGDMASLRSIITLLHEMGHFFDYEEMKKQNLKSRMKEDWHSKNAEQIRKERSASAFALKWMLPFLKNKQFKEDAVNFLKHYALADYNCSAEEEYINDLVKKKHTAREMGDWEVEQEEDMRRQLYDDFCKWQETNAYIQWKEKEENKKLEDYEEFPAWEEWIENMNYDYIKDFKINSQ